MILRNDDILILNNVKHYLSEFSYIRNIILIDCESEFYPNIIKDPKIDYDNYIIGNINFDRIVIEKCSEFKFIVMYMVKYIKKNKQLKKYHTFITENAFKYINRELTLNQL
jgi:hypothetical protein